MYKLKETNKWQMMEEVSYMYVAYRNYIRMLWTALVILQIIQIFVHLLDCLDYK